MPSCMPSPGIGIFDLVPARRIGNDDQSGSLDPLRGVVGLAAVRLISHVLKIRRRPGCAAPADPVSSRPDQVARATADHAATTPPASIIGAAFRAFSGYDAPNGHI
jgi:hypothetical protein